MCGGGRIKVICLFAGNGIFSELQSLPCFGLHTIIHISCVVYLLKARGMVIGETQQHSRDVTSRAWSSVSVMLLALGAAILFCHVAANIHSEKADHIM